MKISVKHLSKKFDKNPVVKNVSFEIQAGEMFFLLGPSGCGKTTILRMLAGFYPPDDGEILFGNKSMTTVSPNERNTALVFQNYALWPHMTVFENVAFGLNVRKVAPAEIDQRVRAALEQVRMENLAERKPTQLSGGQQQRVALARALVVNPDLLLFDEPLSNLDAKLRLEMRHEIQRLHSKTKITSLYVTHDQEEALSMADRIAIMNAGEILQIGTPKQIYERPVNSFVASFIGAFNLYPATSSLSPKLKIEPGKSFGFRPEHVEIRSTGIKATIHEIAYLGNRHELNLQTEKGTKVVAWSPDSHKAGESIHFHVDPKHIHEFTS
jgi:iron(III) transport system ATP-binding protein